MNEKVVSILKRKPCLSLKFYCKICFCFKKKFLIFNFIFIFIKGDDIDSSTNRNFYNQRNQNNYEKIEWLKVSKEIIDVCIALASLDLPPYVLLEIIDWLPLFEYVDHKKKIDLIINVKKSISKIFENKK